MYFIVLSENVLQQINSNFNNIVKFVVIEKPNKINYELNFETGNKLLFIKYKIIENTAWTLQHNTIDLKY